MLSHADLTAILLGLGLLLLVARALGEVCLRFGQPALLGELLAGILLGPSLFGRLAPELAATVFPMEGNVAAFYQGFATLAITLFLVVAGLEVDLSTVWKQGRAALLVGVGGIAIPFAMGFGAAAMAPRFMGMDEHADALVFALFFATALSISALPVIAKTLMDLKLYRSDLGMIIIAAAIFNDLLGWMIFAAILGMIGVAKSNALSIEIILLSTFLFALLMLTVARWIIHRVLPWFQANTNWPASIVGFALALALLCAAFTEWLGVHAIFGAFLFGVALGDSPRLRQKTRTILHEFISFIFAPLFLAMIGLQVDLVAAFDPILVLVVLVIACVGKVLGCGLSARLAGMEWRQSWVVGFGMNARGTMEIILGLLAFQYGLINQRMFVALVIMALVTSMISGPAIQRLLRRPRPLNLLDWIVPGAFIPELKATDRKEAIHELSTALARAISADRDTLREAVWQRELLMPTGIGNGVAIPHARVGIVGTPRIAVGISTPGIDFDAPDGEPAHLVFLFVTPTEDDGAQLAILKEIGTIFNNSDILKEVIPLTSWTGFKALLRTREEIALG